MLNFDLPSHLSIKHLISVEPASCEQFNSKCTVTIFHLNRLLHVHTWGVFPYPVTCGRECDITCMRGIVPMIESYTGTRMWCKYTFVINIWYNRTVLHLTIPNHSVLRVLQLHINCSRLSAAFPLVLMGSNKIQFIWQWLESESKVKK